MKESIVITGSGIVSSIGLDKQETLSSLLAGKSGVSPVRYLKTAHREFPVGEVPLSDEEMKSRLGIHAEPTTRTVLMGMLALDEALGEARLLGTDGRRAILVSGTTVGGMDKTEEWTRVSSSSPTTFKTTAATTISRSMTVARPPI